jgi:hypothetical protein
MFANVCFKFLSCSVNLMLCLGRPLFCSFEERSVSPAGKRNHCLNAVAMAFEQFVELSKQSLTFRTYTAR